MNPMHVVLVASVIFLMAASLPAQAEGEEPAPPREPAAASPAPDPEEDAPVVKPTLAPSFELPGTGDTWLRPSDSRKGPLALVFYGLDEDNAGYRIVGACRDQLENFAQLRAQLCLVGRSSLESHAALLERLPLTRPLFHDKLGETQIAFGLDPVHAAWAVVSTQGVIVDSQAFSGADSESVHEAIGNVLMVLRSLVPPDAPNFVGLMGEPFDDVIDLTTMPDGRVFVLTSKGLIEVIGDTNEPVDLSVPDMSSLAVDPTGMLYVAAGSEVKMLHESEGLQSVWMEEEEGGDRGRIERITCQESGVIMFVRRGKLYGIMPATGRVVPILTQPGAVDLVPMPDHSVVVLRSSKPYLQRVSIERTVTDLPHDDRLGAPPIAGVADPAGRVFIAQSGKGEIYVLDEGGRVLNVFPVRGGGVEGVPSALSLGAGYLDAAVKDSKTGKFRILRFAL